MTPSERTAFGAMAQLVLDLEAELEALRAQMLPAPQPVPAAPTTPPE